jgi:hypothetical protein
MSKALEQYHGHITMSILTAQDYRRYVFIDLVAAAVCQHGLSNDQG